MSKKILILNGSPRSKGNTAMLCDTLSAGARSAGHQVTRFDLHKLDIHGCLGCVKGGKDPASPCVQKDDMGLIYPAYREADIVVLASPMYYWGFSGQLKTAFDRLLPWPNASPAMPIRTKSARSSWRPKAIALTTGNRCWITTTRSWASLAGKIADRSWPAVCSKPEPWPGSLFWIRRSALGLRCR